MMKSMITGIALLIAATTAQALNVSHTWVGGGTDNEWSTVANWDLGTAPANDDYAHIDGYAVSVSNLTAYISATYITNGSVNVYINTLRAAGGGTFHSTQVGIGSGNSASFNVFGGEGQVRWCEVGKDLGSTGTVTVFGGKFNQTHTGNGLWLGANIDGTDAGMGSLVVTGGVVEIAAPCILGSGPGYTGTGTVSVVGSSATSITIGGWEQNTGSILDVGIDSNGVSLITIDAGSATFASNSVLDVDYYDDGSGNGTWTVMEYVGGDIVDNGLALAPGVDTNLWSFYIDNSGANGLLNVVAGGVELYTSITPLNFATYVTNVPTIAVQVTDGMLNVDTGSFTMELVAGGVTTDVTSSLVIDTPAAGVTTFSYTPVVPLEYGTEYTVQYSVAGISGSADDYSSVFTTALDPAVYLIAPGIRNGGFELVDGTNGYTGLMSNWSRVDDWEDVTGAGAKTEAIPAPTEGTRALTTGNSGTTGSATYNITPTTISVGDIFEFKWTIPGRNNGVSVGLAYSNATEVVVVSNSLVYVTGDATPVEYSGSYLFDAATDPDAIGKQVGIIFIDDASGTGAVYVDEVRLYYGNIAIKSVSPAADATGVVDTAPIEVVIAEAASQVDTNSIVLTVDGVDVTASAVISNTATDVTVTYTPATPWIVGKHFVSVSASGTPEGTVGQSWSFVVDPTGVYLISPDLRNGSFELVSGLQGSGTVTDWTTIDDWDNPSVPSDGKTEDNSVATDGSRIFVLGLAETNFNMTATTINDNDRFGYSFVLAGRPNGVYAALAYMDGADFVIITNSMTYVMSGGTTPFPVSAEYTLTSSTDPDAIGKTIGIAIMDEGDGGSVQIDEVRLYSDTTAPTEEPVITFIGVDGSTVTLSWTAQDLGTYSIERKTNLVEPSWTPVLTGLPSGGLTTNVTASGASQEYYQIKGE